MLGTFICLICPGGFSVGIHGTGLAFLGPTSEPLPRRSKLSASFIDWSTWLYWIRIAEEVLAGPTSVFHFRNPLLTHPWMNQTSCEPRLMS